MQNEPLATIEFPHGDRIFLEKDRRWHGENSKFVRLTNSLMDMLPDEKRSNWASSVAHELAAEIGAKVIQVVRHEPDPFPGGPDC